MPKIDRISRKAGDWCHRSAAGLSDALIMMVDDEPLNIEMTGSWLMDAGYRHFVATHEPELAIGMMRDNRPSLLLLDLSMPRVNGMSILRAMHDDPALCHVPVIVMTSSVDPQDRIDALTAGAMDFLPKPADPTELALRVRNTLAAAMYRDYLAHHDALTGLPNGLKYAEAVEAALEAAQSAATPGGLIHLGVHRLELVIDAMGRDAADTVLRRIASRLTQCIAAPPARAAPGAGGANGSGPSLYRLDDGGFAVLAPSCSRAALAGLSARLLEAATIGLPHDGAPPIVLDCRIGVAVFPDDGGDAGALVNNAGTAMRHALQADGEPCEFFKPVFKELALARLAGLEPGAAESRRPEASGAAAARDGEAVAGALLDAAHLHDAILNALPARLAVLDAGGNIFRVNEAWGASREELPGVGAAYAQVCASFGQTPFLTRGMTVGVRRVLEAEASEYREEYSQAASGLWFELVVAPLNRQTRQGVLLVLRDVTARKQAAEAQRRDRQLLDNIVENIPTAVQLKAVGDELRIVLWNKAAEAIYGIDRKQAIGSTVHDLWPAAEAAAMTAAELDLVQRGGQLDFPDRLAHNWLDREIHLHLRKVPLYDDTGAATHLLVIADDVTGQLEREAALRESEERFRSLVQMSTDWYWQQDAHNRFTFFSGDDETSEIPYRSYTMGLTPWELPHRHAFSCTWEEHREMLSQHLPFKGFEYIYRPPGESPTYVSVNGEPMFNSDGVFTGYRGTASDITAAKAAALEIVGLNTKLEERVKQRTRQLEVANSELQAFAYSVAHDIRGPLISLSGFTHLIERNSGSSPQEAERRFHAVGRIRAVVRQMDELTGGLLSLAQLARVGMSWVPSNITELATRVHERLAETDKARVVEFKVAPGMAAPCDAVLMTQLLENLIGNAWKFTAGKPGASISVGCEQDTQTGVRYFVRDNGAGFDAAHATTLFNAFQRFHEPKEFTGTGVGLATVHRIITRHGGKVWAESAPGAGATFYFTLGDAPPA
ncbi:MAG: response regulator [Bdellovibrionales bacterium]|nr:response regulator [Ramlibacter sp.]